MRYMIDGHNVLGALDIAGDEAGIAQLVDKLDIYQRVKNVEILVVFDNQRHHAPYLLFERRGNLRVFASDPKIDRDADDCMVRLISGNPRIASITVVTDDRELRNRLRAEGAKHFMSTIEFMKIVEKNSQLKYIAPPVVMDDAKDGDLTDEQRERITREMSEIFGTQDRSERM